MNTILVVNDDNDMSIRLLYADALSEEGYEVITAESGPGLLDMIESRKPDLVVLDLTAGERGAIGFLEDIRTLRDDLPVIVSTIYPTPPPHISKINADECIETHSDLRELKKTIHTTFEQDPDYFSCAILNPPRKEGGSIRAEA